MQRSTHPTGPQHTLAPPRVSLPVGRARGSVAMFSDQTKLAEQAAKLRAEVSEPRTGQKAGTSHAWVDGSD